MREKIINTIANSTIARRVGEKIIDNRVLWPLLCDFAIRIMKIMAFTGESTDKCLKVGFLPVPIHFYQPIPDIEEMEKRNIWDKVSELKCIKFVPEKYIEFVRLIAREYAHECDWPNEPSEKPMQFHLHNGCFS